MSRGIATAALLGVLVLAGSSGISAHGILKRSSPPAGTVVRSAPMAVTIWFSEPVDRVYSSASVADVTGRVVSGRAMVSADGRMMTVPLRPGVGTFTVEWRVLSQLDGHTTTGRFRFGVRAARTGPVDAPPVETPEPALISEGNQTGNEGEFDVSRAAVRWIGLAAVLVVAGTAFFQWLIVRPTATHLEIAPILRPIYIGSAAVMATTAIAEFLLQATALLDLPFAQLLTSGLLAGLIVDSKTGWSAVSRVVLAGIFLVPSTPRGRVFRMASVIWVGVVGVVLALLSNPGLATGSRHFAHFVALLLMATVYGLITAVGALILPLVPDLKLPEGRWASPVAGLMALGAITIGSHAVGRSLVAVAVDWAHLAAAAAWIGGLVPLALVLVRATGDRSDLVRRIVPRFSQVAGWSLLVLVVTGTFGAWLHIPALGAFVATLYGRALFLKLLLVVPLITLGAINRFVLRPRIERGSNGGARRTFQRSIRAEAILGAGVLLAVGVLTITPPASVSYSTMSRPPVILAGLAGDTRVKLTVTQGRESSRFLVELAPFEPDIQVTLTDLGRQRDSVVLLLTPAGGRSFVGEGAAFDGNGMWQIELRIRSQSSPPTVIRFPFLVETLPRQQDQSAIRLLERVHSTLKKTRVWSTAEHITDGSGNAVRSTFEGIQPDRLRYRTSTNVEGIIIGARRYQRQGGGAWQRDVLPSPLVVSGPFTSYIAAVDAAALGRKEDCGSETCQVVLWQTVEPRASFAGWIGLTTLRIHRLYMVAPAHFMTAEPRRVTRPIKIIPP